MRNSEPIFPNFARRLRDAMQLAADQINQPDSGLPVDPDAVQILVQCGESQVLHVITCTALDKLRGPEHILGGLVYEMTKAVRQKDPT